MTRLIPEKRVDKNGVLTTKHVRAGAKPSAALSSLPAPKLAEKTPSAMKRKPPSKVQLKSYHWTFVATGDRHLAKALGSDTDLETYTFTASEAEIYGMLSHMRTGCALLMLQSGYRDSKEAESYLLENGLDRFLQQRDMALEAQDRRIPVDTFIRVTQRASEERLNSPYFIDGLETAGIAALKDNYSWEVEQGLIRLSDIKALGATRIKKADSWNTIGDALKTLASSEANYRAEDLREVLDKHSPVTSMIKKSITLMEHYGADIIHRIPSPSMTTMDVHSDLVAKDIDPERSASILGYATELFHKVGVIYSDYEDYYTLDEIIRFHDAGVSTDDVANKTITINQLDAIEDHGIAPSVSGGWL